MIARVLDHLAADRDAALERVFALLRFPSVSMDPNADAACGAAAAWLADNLADLGFTSRVLPTSAHPIVLAHRPASTTGAPHLLFYGHYDVQPAEPVALWTRPPFDPALVAHPQHGSVIQARGASDDKGQLMTFLEAARAWIAVTGGLPIGLTFVIEGDEEADSGHLDAFFSAHADALAADAVLICDSEALDATTPAITTSVRGFTGGEIRIRAAERDLHSGDFGGIAPNPACVLSRLLSGLYDAQSRVTIDGFYDGVEDLSDDKRAAWSRFDAAQFLGAVGLRQPAGEHGFTVFEQAWARPTAEINGFWSGYRGPGGKTIIPAQACAKLTFRLVPGQDPQAIMDAFEAHVRARLPADCQLELARWDGTRAATVAADHRFLQPIMTALADEWGTPPALVASGGSIPIVSLFKERLGMDAMMVGFALEDDNAHAPNEKYNLAAFQRGCRSWARIIGALAEGHRT